MTIHHVSRMVLFVCILSGAFLVCVCFGQAWAIKGEAFLDFKQAADRSRAPHSKPRMARRTMPKAPLRPHGIQSRATPPAMLKGAKETPEIRITPASASWKVNGLSPRLVQLLVQAQVHFGRPLHIVSGCRSKAHNRRVNGANHSQHLNCNAADFLIPGVSKYKLAAYLKQMQGRGGIGTYCGSSFVHLDIGPKRQWHWKCAKRRTYEQQRPRQNYTSSTK